MEESLVKIADYMTAVGAKKSEATGNMPSFVSWPHLTCSLGEGGWTVTVTGGGGGYGSVVSICHPKMGEALRRAADNLPPLPEK